jgi:glycosyltransferase involved in cell wall biosynthesis
MKKISIVTNYFPPETGAASNRIAKLALGLKERGFKVSVICPLPNYPKGKVFEGYRGKTLVKEQYKGVEVIRLWVYANNSANKFKRLLGMVSFSASFFFFSVLKNKNIAKTVIIQSPPLIIAHSVLRFLSQKKRNLILNVSDLWPSAGYELGAIKKGRSYDLLEKIEKYNYQKPQLVLGQSKEILERVKAIVPQQKVFLYRNFPQPPHEPQPPVYSSAKSIKIVYAGLLGIAQGIVKLCQEIELPDTELHIYGAGAEKEALEEYLKTSSKPILYHGEVMREELLSLLNEYDLAIVPLIRSIYGSTPSKIYEMAHNNLPVLYFAGGEGEAVIKNHQLGYVVPPADYSALNKRIQNLNLAEINKLKEKIRETALINFNIEEQLEELAEKLKTF